MMEIDPSNSPSSQLIEAPAQAPQQEQQPQPQASTSFTIFVYKFLSLISWVLLVITSLESYLRGSMIFSAYKLIDMYIPISISLGLLQSFFLLILFFGFYHFAYLGLYKGDNTIVDPLFNTTISKLHFIPLLLVSFININLMMIKDRPNIADLEGNLIDGLIFTMIALGLLGFIYFKTEFNHDWFIVLTIKKGIFSYLIVFLWYSFFYYIVLIGIIKYLTSEDLEDLENLSDFLKGTGIAFAILIGLGSLAFAFIFKDLIAALTNLLIYIGMITSFFGIKGKDNDQKADGVIEIIMMVVNLACIGILIFKFNNSLLDNKYSFSLG